MAQWLAFEHFQTDRPFLLAIFLEFFTAVIRFSISLFSNVATKLKLKCNVTGIIFMKYFCGLFITEIMRDKFTKRLSDNFVQQFRFERVNLF